MNRSKVLQVIEYVKGSPETMDYGKWGALNPEQRHFIACLCESWLILDGATNLQTKEIDRLNNIINGMEKFFQYAYDNEVRPLNDRKVSVWTICLDKLQELKEMIVMSELDKSLKEQLESVINENQKLLEKHFQQDSKIVKLIEENNYYKNQLQQKENIIKEVREYANNIMFETRAEEKIQDDILEILGGE